MIKEVNVYLTSLPALHCMRSGKPHLCFCEENFCGGQLAHENYPLYGIDSCTVFAMPIKIGRK